MVRTPDGREIAVPDTLSPKGQQVRAIGNAAAQGAPGIAQPFNEGLLAGAYADPAPAPRPLPPRAQMVGAVAGAMGSPAFTAGLMDGAYPIKPPMGAPAPQQPDRATQIQQWLAFKASQYPPSTTPEQAARWQEIDRKRYEAFFDAKAPKGGK